MGKNFKQRFLDVERKANCCGEFKPVSSDLIIDTTPITGGSTGAIFYEKVDNTFGEIMGFQYDDSNKTLSYFDDVVSPEVVMLMGKLEIVPGVFIPYSGFGEGNNPMTDMGIAYLDATLIGDEKQIFLGKQFGARIIISDQIVNIISDQIVNIISDQYVSINADQNIYLNSYQNVNINADEDIYLDAKQIGIFGASPVGQQPLSIDPSTLPTSNDTETTVKEIAQALINYGLLTL